MVQGQPVALSVVIEDESYQDRMTEEEHRKFFELTS